MSCLSWLQLVETGTSFETGSQAPEDSVRLPLYTVLCSWPDMSVAIFVAGLLKFQRPTELFRKLVKNGEP